MPVERHEPYPTESLDARQIGRLLDERLLTNHFQPIVDLATQSIFAYEALCRPRDGHFTNPKQLVTSAAECGLVGALGRLQRTLAVADCAAWPLFLNIEPNEFDEPFLVRPDDPIFRHRSPVYLEITESVPISFFSQCQSILAEIRKKGVLLAIDDLGAGFSNLQYITDLEPDIVKLDRELIRGCTTNSRTFAFLQSMTRLCHDMNARLIAEGIETEEELEAVLEAGVDLGQGYLLARPGNPPPDVVWPARVVRRSQQPTHLHGAARGRGEAPKAEHGPIEQLQLQVRELRAELAESEYRRESLESRQRVMSQRLREAEGRSRPPPEEADADADPIRRSPETSAEGDAILSADGAAKSAGERGPARLAPLAAALALGLAIGWMLSRQLLPPSAPATEDSETVSGSQMGPDFALGDSPAVATVRLNSAPGGRQLAAAGDNGGSPATDPSSRAAEVVAAVNDWAVAWSAQDVRGYLASYSGQFEPPGETTSAAWRAERRRRILSPASLSVTLTGLEISFPEPDLARAVFTQFYEAPAYSDSVRKTLDLRQEASGWKIVREVSEPI